jgi:hypothetical protein
VELLIHL